MQGETKKKRKEKCMYVYILCVCAVQPSNSCLFPCPVCTVCGLRSLMRAKAYKSMCASSYALLNMMLVMMLVMMISLSLLTLAAIGIDFYG